MSEQEAVSYIEEWDVTEAAKVLKWYEEDELLRPCDCDTIVAIETEKLEAENAKLRQQLADVTESMGRVEERCAKLRELVRWMYYLMDESCAVQHPYAPAPISYDRLLQAQARAHDLGVEVQP